MFAPPLRREGVLFLRQIKQVQGRGSILLPPQAAKVPGPDAGCEGIERASCFVIQDHQTRQSQRSPMCGQRSVERHHTHNLRMDQNFICAWMNKSVQRQNVGG